jgi:hypothetical protein
MQGIKKDLLHDVECYMCGEEPSPLLMLRAARLENWETEVRRRGKSFALSVSGDVYGHPEITDGTWMSTSAVVWFDRHRRWIRTHSRLYKLGEQAGVEIPLEGIDV